MPVDYSLYLVTDRSVLQGRDIFKAVEEAIQGGVTLVQLREKEISSQDFYYLALKMKELVHCHGIPLIINDRLDIALAVDADGLHIGQGDLPLPAVRSLLGPDKLLGYSVASVAEAQYGQKHGADYLGAQPVFPTGSKLDLGEPLGNKGIAAIRHSVSIPVVGIGGIGPANIAALKETGIEGVAVISAILGCPDIERAARDLRHNW